MIDKKTAIIAVLLVIVGLTIISFPGQAPNTNVAIFILDDFHQTSSLTTAQRATHGEIVEKVIKTEAPAVEVIPYSVADNEGEINKQLYFAGLRRVLNYAQEQSKRQIIVNVSLSFFNDDRQHHQLIKQLSQRGVKVVAAAGNDDSDQPVYPAGYQEVIAVANANQTGKLANSNYGAYIDLAAPGSVKHISRAYYGSGMGIRTLKAAGTSFSAPRVVGLLAKLVSKEPNLTLEAAGQIITRTAQPIKSVFYQESKLGAGVIDKPQALGRVIPNYQLHKKLILVSGIVIVLLVSLGLVINYQLAGIFFTLLLLLVGIPLAALLGEQFRLGGELITKWAASRGMGLIALINILGSAVVALVVTSWQKTKVIISYLILLLVGIIVIHQLSKGQVVSRLFWGWTAFLIGLEWLLLVYLKTFTELEQLVKFSCCPSQEVAALIKNKLVNAQAVDVLEQVLQQETSWRQKILSIEALAEIGTDQAHSLLLKQLGTSPPAVEKAVIKELLKFSPAEVGPIVVFADKHNLSAVKLLDWWPEISEPEIEELLTLTQHQDEAVAKLAGEILAGIDSQAVVEKIKDRLTALATQDREILLTILIKLGTKAQSALPQIVSIICGADDVWLRYKGLRALQTIAPAPEKFISLFQILQQEEEELIRLEAKGIEKEIAANCK